MAGLLVGPLSSSVFFLRRAAMAEQLAGPLAQSLVSSSVLFLRSAWMAGPRTGPTSCGHSGYGH